MSSGYIRCLRKCRAEFMKKTEIRSYVLLFGIVLLYSFGGVFSKTAAGLPFLSLKWLLLYGGLIGILGIYAIVWQQVLKKVPLNVAYVCKSLGIVWGMVWGVLFFGESLSAMNLLGCGLVVAGVILILTGGQKNE